MAKALVYANGIKAGILEKRDANAFYYTYDPLYLSDISLPPISLTLPKQIEPFYSAVLFPFFYGLLAEGSMKKQQCEILKIDENDHFTRLLKTAQNDTIGFITLVEET